jgi:thiol-disulfide isomerase/thioredoxin
MTHYLPTADLTTLSDTAFWTHYHSAATARDHRVWVACGGEFVRRHLAEAAAVPVEQYHARLGPAVYHLWETAQARYRGLPDPPIRTGPPSPDEAGRYGQGGHAADPALVRVTDAWFGEEVLAVSGRVVVLLWATWSGPDRLLRAWLRERLYDWPGVKFAEVNVDDHPEVAIRYDLRSVPTALAFEGGQLVGRLEGLPGYDRDVWARAFDGLAGRSGTDATG